MALADTCQIELLQNTVGNLEKIKYEQLVRTHLGELNNDKIGLLNKTETNASLGLRKRSVL